jgi:integrase
VPIPDRLFPVIQEAIADSPSEHVFPGADGGKQRDDVKLSKTLQSAFRAAGLVSGWRYICGRKGCGFKEERQVREPSKCPTCGQRLIVVGIPREVRFYDLRHAAATLHRKAGCDPLVVQLALGHAATNTTDEIYTHFTKEEIRVELNKLSL